MIVLKIILFYNVIYFAVAQPPMGGIVAPGAAAPPPPPPPPGRGFQLTCSDAFAMADLVDPALFNAFAANTPPGYEVASVDPTIYPGKNAHRFLVKYRSIHFRRCEDIRRVFQNMTTYKPQNCNIGSIAVVPGGYLVEYKQFCQCYRRSYRKRRQSNWKSYFFQTHQTTPPRTESNGSIITCDDRDVTCGYQAF